MKYFLLLLLLSALSYKNAKPQQLVIKCASNSITIDSTAKLEKSFFSCDSVGIEIIKPNGAYEMQIVRMNKNNPAWVNRVIQKPNDVYNINSKIFSEDYQDIRKLIVTITDGKKFVKAFTLNFN